MMKVSAITAVLAPFLVVRKQRGGAAFSNFFQTGHGQCGAKRRPEYIILWEHQLMNDALSIFRIFSKISAQSAKPASSLVIFFWDYDSNIFWMGGGCDVSFWHVSGDSRSCLSRKGDRSI